MQKSEIIFGLVVSVFLACASSPTSTSRVHQSTPRLVTLWEIGGEGTSPSHVLGTCHIGVTLDQALPKKYQKLITEASVFVMEVDLNGAEAGAMVQRLSLPSGETLSGFIGEEKWAAIVKATNLGDAGEAFNRMHPFALYASLIHRMTEGLNTGAPGMDLAAYDMAVDADVQDEFLETVEEQLDIFFSIPLKEWVKGLKELAAPGALEAMRKELDATLEVCRSGDISIFAAQLEERRAEDPEGMAIIEERMFTLRNRGWIPKLDALFRQGPVFVAVGVGHMVGDEGLVSLLEGKGYTVKQLSGRTEVAPTIAESTAPKGYPLASFIDQLATGISVPLCAKDSVALQCTEAPARVCREIVTMSVQTCADLEGLPSEIPTEKIMATSMQISDCVGAEFWQLMPSPTRMERPACKEAMSKAKPN